MPRGIVSAQMLLACLLFAACTAEDPPVRIVAQGTAPPAAVAPAPGAPAPAVQSRLPGFAPRFEPNACPFTLGAGQVEGETVTCGFVVVPEEYTRPDGRTIRLAVAVFKARTNNPEPAPLVWLAGGPGGHGLDGVAPQVSGRVAETLLAHRDLVIFDQRGAGYSQPSLACREVTEAKYAALSQPLSPADEANGLRAAALRCRDRLRGERISPAAYSSAASAADVDAIRRALGYEQINLYGVSYGSRLALTVMRDFPGILRSVVLDAVVPLQANFYVDMFASAQRAVDLLFRRCAADPACSTAYPELESVFYALVARLNQSPARLQIRHARTGQLHDFVVTGTRFAAGIFEALYRSGLIPTLPWTIYRARAGDFEPFALTVRDALFIDGVSHGMHYSVQCSEEVRFAGAAEIAAAGRAVRPEIAAALGGGAGEPALLAICAAWDARPAAPVENEPVRGDVPTLLLSGEYDPITPPAYAELAARTLTRAFAFTLPGAGHGAASGGDCPIAVIVAFLREPTAQPNAACIARMSGPVWAHPGR